MNDRWKHLRQGLFRNVEPAVKLVAITKPVGEFEQLCTTETLPAFTARASHQSEGTQVDDLRLNKFLIGKKHFTPFESVAMTFFINGITKSLQNQWVRHRIGIGWTFRSTRFVSAEQNEYVYSTYDYIEDENEVKYQLDIDERIAKMAIEYFKIKRDHGATKQDARKIMPIFFNTPCYCYCNAVSLRHALSLRLAPDAEWEVRRLHKLFFELAMKESPSLFEDFAELARKED